MIDQEPHGRGPERRRRSLRARLAMWMVVSTAFTVFFFACVVYLLVRAEANEGALGSSEDAREQVLIAMVIAGPACLLVSVAGARLLSRRALAPIAAAIREAGAMTAETLGERLHVPMENDELRDLVVVLNALLARLDEGFTALGTYAASASHELRTPLAVITSELEVALRRSRTVEEWERTARTSLDEMRRLARLVEALLDLSRPSASTNRARAPFELGEQLDQTLASLEESLRPARAELLGVHDHDRTWIEGDPDLFMNAVRELVWNAARYSPAGSTVRVRVQRRVNGRIAVDVDDCGKGVAPKERQTIFAPFMRGQAGVDAGHARRGFGLGLAIAKRSVEMLGGTITVGDSPEGGARFTILVAASDAPR